MEYRDESVVDNERQPIRYLNEEIIISVEMFGVLCIATLGLYQIWWSYKAWWFFKEKDRLNVHPPARALFSLIFMPSLFNKILRYAKDSGYEHSYSSAALFIGYIFVTALSWLPDPWWLIAVLGFVLYIPPFNALNYAKQHAIHIVATEQASFSKRQIVLMVIGALFWGMLILSVMFEGT